MRQKHASSRRHPRKSRSGNGAPLTAERVLADIKRLPPDEKTKLGGALARELGWVDRFHAFLRFWAGKVQQSIDTPATLGPDRSELALDLWGRRDRGQSWQAIALDWNEQGRRTHKGTLWTKAAVQRFYTRSERSGWFRRSVVDVRRFFGRV